MLDVKIESKSENKNINFVCLLNTCVTKKKNINNNIIKLS